MEKIGLDKLAIYNKHGGDEAMLHERGVDKKDKHRISSAEFGTLALIEDNLAMLQTNICYKEFAKKLELELEEAKLKVTEAVFEQLQKK